MDWLAENQADLQDCTGRGHPVRLGRYLLHRQVQQRRTDRGNQLHVPVVCTIASMLCFLEDCSGELSEERLASSRWISRGWTLQELIAPQSVIFFNRHWDRVGNRSDLSRSLYNATGIPQNILKNAGWYANSQSLQNIPICKRMSWAAGRKTSRVEDAAYCLMGLFGVNMPLLYGEGHKAFIRLQEEIMRRSNDMTIFAWEAAASDYGKSIRGEQILGLLARSPDAFAGSDFDFTRANTFGQEFSLTNRGIRISIGNVRTNGESDDFVLCLSGGGLTCQKSGGEILGVAIRPIGGGLFVRSQPKVLLTEHPSPYRAVSPAADLYLVTELTSQVIEAHDLVKNEHINVPQLEGVGLYCTCVFPQLQYQHDSNGFLTQGFDSAVGYATYESRLRGTHEDGKHAHDLIIFFGVDDGIPWCTVSSADHYPDWSKEEWAQEDNLKRYGSVAYRERSLTWVLETSGSSNESRHSVTVVDSQFGFDDDGGWDLGLVFQD